MKTTVILNPQAAAGRAGREAAKIQNRIVASLGACEIVQTTQAGEATLLTRKALEEGSERIVSVGGDGTNNEVVNGFFKERSTEVVREGAALSFFPMGTGGDFCRVLGLNERTFEEAYRDAELFPMDVGTMWFQDPQGEQQMRHFLNVASFGGSGVITQKVGALTKLLGGKLAYYVGTINGLMSYKNKRVRVRIDQDFDEEMVVNTAAVGNSTCFGGGMYITPNANIRDGELDMVVAGDVGVVTFLRCSSHIYKATHLDLPFFRQLRGKHIRIDALEDGDVFSETDGELCGSLPLEFRVQESAIRLFAPAHPSLV